MPNVPSTTEEVEAIYDSGREATVALIQQLVVLISNQQQTIGRLTQRVEELEQRLNRNSVASSDNSSQPPSADGFNRPPPPSPRSLRQSSGKKPGAQPGHKGKTLRFSDMPDRVVQHRPGECAECGYLEDVPAIPQATQRRQVAGR